MGSNQLEPTTLDQPRKASLGESLVAVREGRGLSRETVVQQTHIPAHYLQMLEDDDYRLIADQLYLLPFLRKYAFFLEIDQDETAMRLVRAVQRADNNTSPIRLDEPLDDIRRYRRRNWSKPIIFGGLIAVIIGAYIAQSRRNDTDKVNVPTVQPSPVAVSSESSASNGAMSSLSASQSSSPASVNRPDSSTPLQSRAGSTTSTPQHTQSVTQAMIVPVAAPEESPNLARSRTTGVRQLANH